MNDNINNNGNGNVIGTGNIIGNGNIIQQDIDISGLMDIKDLAAEAHNSKTVRRRKRSSRIKQGLIEAVLGIVIGIAPPAIKVYLNWEPISFETFTKLVSQDFWLANHNWLFLFLFLIGFVSITLGVTTLTSPTTDEKRQIIRINAARERAVDLGYTEKEWRQALRKATQQQD